MASKDRQVPQQGLTAAQIQEISPDLSEKAAAWLANSIESSRRREKTGFPELQGTKRRYPGEAQGQCLTHYFAQTRASRKAVFLRSLRILQQLEEAARKKDVDLIHNTIRPRLGIAYGPLINELARLTQRRGLLFETQVHEAGLVIHPTTPESHVALAILLLEKQRRLTRVRQCLACGNWFYARFKHQRFCSDPTKRCQWNFYHTPAWRKRNRERNRRHQREYRKRIFGRRH